MFYELLLTKIKASLRRKKEVIDLTILTVKMEIVHTKNFGH